MVLPLVWVALGGAAGAVARYLVDGWVAERVGRDLPWGILVVNVSGCFAAGLLFAIALERDVLSEEVRLPLMVGFLGAYTTFSTLMLDSWRLVELGAAGPAIVNVVGSSVLGLVAVILGTTVGRAAG